MTYCKVFQCTPLGQIYDNFKIFVLLFRNVRRAVRGLEISTCPVVHLALELGFVWSSLFTVLLNRREQARLRDFRFRSLNFQSSDILQVLYILNDFRWSSFICLDIYPFFVQICKLCMFRYISFLSLDIHPLVVKIYILSLIRFISFIC